MALLGGPRRPRPGFGKTHSGGQSRRCQDVVQALWRRGRGRGVLVVPLEKRFWGYRALAVQLLLGAVAGRTLWEPACLGA